MENSCQRQNVGRVFATGMWWHFLLVAGSKGMHESIAKERHHSKAVKLKNTSVTEVEQKRPISRVQQRHRSYRQVMSTHASFDFQCVSSRAETSEKRKQKAVSDQHCVSMILPCCYCGLAIALVTAGRASVIPLSRFMQRNVFAAASECVQSVAIAAQVCGHASQEAAEVFPSLVPTCAHGKQTRSLGSRMPQRA